MARITVEDCLDHVDNRFQLVLVATQRARQLAHGASPLVDVDNDKHTVVALREIAEGLVTKAILEEDPNPLGLSDEFMEHTSVTPEESPTDATADPGEEETA